MPLDLSRRRPLHVACARGLAPWVRQEVERLGYAVREEHATGVSLEGSLQDAMRLDLHLRCAYRVVLELDAFRAATPEALYERVVQLPWEELIAADGYLSVASRVDTPAVQTPLFANLKVKDAVVDRLQEALGRRPDSGPDQERGVVLRLSWKADRCWLSLDTTGRKLSDRGYRKLPHKAPLRESLAAAILLAAGYDGERPLVNPMCGAGTLAIEAALIAAHRAPGLLRDDFAFRHLRTFDAAAWAALRGEARAARRKRGPAPIVATDHDPRAVAAAQQNARTAGVDHLIEFAVCDFAETELPPPGDGGGVVVLNPEYGKRLGDRTELQATYGRIGDFLKQRCRGYTGAVFTCDLDLAKKVGLRTRRRIEMHNGDLEGRLLLYELYSGSKKAGRGNRES